MSRRPIHLEPVAGAPNGRAAVWATIRKVPDGFTSGDMPACLSKTTVRNYFQGLKTAGYIAVVSEGRRNSFSHPLPTVYRLERDVGVEPPRVTNDGKVVTQGLAQEQMWRTMAAMASFSTKELAVNASTDAVQVSEVTAKSYIYHLTQAGYLKCIRKGKPGTQARYQLLKHKRTGPKAPAVQQPKVVYDLNTKINLQWEGALRPNIPV